MNAQGKCGKGKRQLDCAGVVTTTLAVIERLATHEEHADLRRCRLQVPPCHLASPCQTRNGIWRLLSQVSSLADSSAPDRSSLVECLLRDGMILSMRFKAVHTKVLGFNHEMVWGLRKTPKSHTSTLWLCNRSLRTTAGSASGLGGRMPLRLLQTQPPKEARRRL